MLFLDQNLQEVLNFFVFKGFKLDIKDESKSLKLSL